MTKITIENPESAAALVFSSSELSPQVQTAKANLVDAEARKVSAPWYATLCEQDQTTQEDFLRENGVDLTELTNKAKSTYTNRLLDGWLENAIDNCVKRKALELLVSEKIKEQLWQIVKNQFMDDIKTESPDKQSTLFAQEFCEQQKNFQKLVTAYCSLLNNTVPPESCCALQNYTPDEVTQLASFVPKQPTYQALSEQLSSLTPLYSDTQFSHSDSWKLYWLLKSKKQPDLLKKLVLPEHALVVTIEQTEFFLDPALDNLANGLATHYGQQAAGDDFNLSTDADQIEMLTLFSEACLTQAKQPVRTPPGRNNFRQTVIMQLCFNQGLSPGRDQRDLDDYLEHLINREKKPAPSPSDHFEQATDYFTLKNLNSSGFSALKIQITTYALGFDHNQPEVITKENATLLKTILAPLHYNLDNKEFFPWKEQPFTLAQHQLLTTVMQGMPDLVINSESSAPPETERFHQLEERFREVYQHLRSLIIDELIEKKRRAALKTICYQLSKAQLNPDNFPAETVQKKVAQQAIKQLHSTLRKLTTVKMTHQETVLVAPFGTKKTIAYEFEGVAIHRFGTQLLDVNYDCRSATITVAGFR